VSKGQKKVFIIDGLRTIIGRKYKSLKEYSAAELAAYVLQSIVKRNKIKEKFIDQIIVGNSLSAGLGQNIARQAGALAGLPFDIPAYMVNNVCGAGLQALLLGMESILSGRNYLIAALGADSVTHAPFLVKKEEVGNESDEKYIDSLFYDGLFCQQTAMSMGMLAEQFAEKHSISREEQDLYALRSHKKASAALDEGALSKEIIFMEQKKRKDAFVDDSINKNITIEKLKQLPPAFLTGGTITAGNASSPCDGAVVILSASEEFVKEKRITPMARILEYTHIAIDPKETYESSAIAIKKCLKASGMLLKDIDVFEICEAFAAQMVFLQHNLRIPSSKLNIFGGDLALGHPMGASGLRAVVTLMNVLRSKGKEKGLICVSFGGGGAIAVILEMIS